MTGRHASRTVSIRYHRPPDRTELFQQHRVAEQDGCTVTFLERTQLREPLRVAGEVILEPGSPVVWFTFAGAWHDIGRFHTAAGRFTGIYANILTPVAFLARDAWETTDLCLDVWQDPAGTTVLLDEDELRAAERNGWIAPDQAAHARAEAERLLAAAHTGTWPPPIVQDWTLERVVGELASRA